MKLMLDNNLPPALAHALHDLSHAYWDDTHQVVALRARFPAATPDADWIIALSQ